MKKLFLLSRSYELQVFIEFATGFCVPESSSLVGDGKHFKRLKVIEALCKILHNEPR